MKRLFLILSALAIFLVNCTGLNEGKRIENLTADSSLTAHTEIFKKGVVKIGNRVYSAIGYGLANSIMIEGTNGIIIVDTMESVERGKDVLKAFREITKKPVQAIIYTHNHADHTFGTKAFYDGTPPAIYAHEKTNYFVTEFVGKMSQSLNTRSIRMFGNTLDKKELINAGIGPFLGIDKNSTMGYVAPTIVFPKILDLEAAGIKFQLIHAPGETDDQIYLWLPDEKILLSADNFYWSFPNLYTIRGTVFRSLKQWYESLDIIRDLKPAYLVPSHGRPITGKDEIYRIITNYRDAIQYVHDQGIRGMNLGMTPDELVEHIKLPLHLAAEPYLQEFYGKVSWSLRSLYSGELGWFSGDSADLQSLSKLQEAKLISRLAGGDDKLLRTAEELFNEKEYQGALQLTGHLLYIDPDNSGAKKLRIKALTSLGSRESNANARHWYLTEAIELRDNFVVKTANKPEPDTVRLFPLENFFATLPVKLITSKAVDVNKIAGISFPAENEAFTINIRNGVAEVREIASNIFNDGDYDIKVEADPQLWKEMLAGIRSPVMTFPKFRYLKGNAVSFGLFLSHFAPGKRKLECYPYK